MSEMSEISEMSEEKKNDAKGSEYICFDMMRERER